MTDDKNSSTPASSAPSSPATPSTPAGNQNLIIGLVLGAVVLLLFLLVLQMTGGGFGGESEVDKLKAERDAKREALQSRSGSATSADGQSAQALANRLSTDSAALAGMITKMQAMLTKSETDLRNANTTNQVLSQQIANASAHAAENLKLKNELNTAQARATQAEGLVNSLQQQLNNAHTKSEMEAVRAQLEQALQDRDALRQQVTELTRQMKSMEDSDVARALREELTKLNQKAGKLEKDNNDLIYEVQKLRAQLDRAKLYVEAEALPAKAKLLYDELSKLETANPAELKTSYERIEQDLNASVVDTIKFPTGSSNVNRDDVEKISRKVKEGGNESFFLVVGYASKSGGLEANKTLSANRATRIASVTNFHKKSEQKVQAVFLSETDRFGADLPANQICELWEIRK